MRQLSCIGPDHWQSYVGSKAEREDDIHNQSWTQTAKKKALCRDSQRAWSAKEPRLTLHSVTDEEGHFVEDADDSGARLCAVGSGIGGAG